MSKTKPAAPPATPPAASPARPTGGGSFIRDRKTGALTRAEGRPTPPPPVDDPSGSGAANPNQEG